jgi:hypothetical protein
MSTPKPPGYWTKDRCKEEASKYTTRAAWRKESATSVNAARKGGWYEECCAHMLYVTKPGYSHEELLVFAKQFETRFLWQKGHVASYLYAHRRGLLDELCVNMTPRFLYTEEAILESAARYKGMREWSLAEHGFYDAAQRKGMLSAIAATKRKGGVGRDSDAAYMWCADGQIHNGKRVCKFGLSSARLKDDRIKQARTASGLTPTEVIIVKRADAAAVEKELLALGESPNYKGFIGCTEFRALTEDEIKLAKQKILCGAEKVLLQSTNQISLSN